MEQDPKLGQIVASKVYADMLASCFDKITELEAARYNDVAEEDTVDCDSQRWKDVMPADVMKYQAWKDESELKPTVHQIVLSNALKVRGRFCEAVT